jgi:hypothetical protein
VRRAPIPHQPQINGVGGDRSEDHQEQQAGERRRRREGAQRPERERLEHSGEEDQPGAPTIAWAAVSRNGVNTAVGGRDSTVPRQ